MNRIFEIAWNIKDVTKYFSIGIILLIFEIILIISFDLKNILEIRTGRAIFISLLLLTQWICLFGPFLIWAIKNKKISFKSLGFIKVKTGRLITQVVSHYLLYLGISFIILIFIIFSDIQIPGFQLQQNILPLFGESKSDLIIAGIVIVFVAPVIEEVFFRGVLLQSLIKFCGKFKANVLTALLFASIHLQFQNFVPIFILGLIINSLFIKNNSLWPPITFHILNNGIAILLEIFVINEINF